MLSKRIIPCLDVKNGLVVKGIKFQELKEVGDPVTMAKEYDKQCADELVFLDITATNEKRSTVVKLVEKVAEQLSIPFTIGGGVWSTEDIRILLQSGADKVAINTAAVMKPNLISEAAESFGSQCVVVAIDAKRNNDRYEVVINAGKKLTGIDVFDWVKIVQKLGAGEILLTSMNRDGTKQGFDIELYQKVDEVSNLPLIASGGGGSLDSFTEVFRETKVDAALGASIFHYSEFTVTDVKEYLREQGMEVRL